MRLLDGNSFPKTIIPYFFAQCIFLLTSESYVLQFDLLFDTCLDHACVSFVVTEIIILVLHTHFSEGDIANTF